MFQNISGEDITNDNEDINSKNKKFNLEKLFTIQDIVIYVISFMISMVGFGKEFAPFSFAFFSAICGCNIPAGIVFLTTCIGTLIGFGVNGFLNYLITALLFIVSILVIRPMYNEESRNEKKKLGKYVFICSFVVQAGKMLFSMFLFYDLIASITISVITYIFYKIFVNSITVIKEYGIKKAFTIEEVMGASMLISIACYAFSPINVFGLSICNIISIMLVLFLGWKNGILVGATSGITIGIVLRNNRKYKSCADCIFCNITEC